MALLQEGIRYFKVQSLHPSFGRRSIIAIDNGILMQRICDDVPAFTEGSTALLFGITRKLFGVLAFSGMQYLLPLLLKVQHLLRH